MKTISKSGLKVKANVTAGGFPRQGFVTESSPGRNNRGWRGRAAVSDEVLDEGFELAQVKAEASDCGVGDQVASLLVHTTPERAIISS